MAQVNDFGDAEPRTARSSLEIGADDFARRFSLRSWNLMWFLGAGASGAGGIPTAGDMIWEFKQTLFVSQRHAARETVADLSSPAIRQHLQAHIDSLGNLARAGAPDEYSALFEAVFPSEGDRRKYIDLKISAGKPSYGHLALATLMRGDRARIVWTTNFDTLVADACAKAFEGTGALTSVALEMPTIARQAINEERWPIEVKLHGDFRSRRLKNTSDELREQDQELRQVLVDASQRLGLIVAGYSGRDDSIMSTLESAITIPGAFPSGLFWWHRGEDAPYERVTDLIRQAASRNIEAALVRIHGFDEAMRDLLRLLPNLNTKLLDEFAKSKARWSAAPVPTGRGGWPVIRFNALRFEQIPTVCRRIVCKIGGAAEVAAAVDNANVELIVARRKIGIIGFGSDADARSAFENYEITEFDIAPIDPKRLRYDSAERGLLREAFSRALANGRSMNLIRRRTRDLLYPSDSTSPNLRELAKLVPGLYGSFEGFPELKWFEGISLRIEWANEHLWVLFDPSIVFENITDENRAVAAEFGREHTFNRYNKKLDQLIDFWSRFIIGDGSELRALNVSVGVDAAFKVAPRTAFTRRVAA